MKAECPSCALHPERSKTATWIATGHIAPGRRGLPAAALRCVQCGRAWNCGLPDAIAAARQVQLERGDAVQDDEVSTPAPLVQVPAPTLFGASLPRQSQGFVSAGELARRAHANYKRRQGGDR